MTASQRRLHATPPIAHVRPEYVAAVRYPDGKRDLFHIRNANSLADARELVLLEVGDVRSLVVALRH
jgi:hypothetical protein